MERYFKYKRFQEIFDEKELELFFDELIKGGWEILSYKETEVNVDIPIRAGIDAPRKISKLKITVIAGKKQIML